MDILRFAQLWARRFGFDIFHYNSGEHPVARRQRLIENYCIDTVLDVGANADQFGLELRRQLEYRGHIVSFEPLRAAYAELRQAARGDASWKVLCTGRYAKHANHPCRVQFGKQLNFGDDAIACRGSAQLALRR
ncbi:hypothetical protein [Variovorax sp. dw_308]|uniref:hypothetical protein n=1 Tax=Variovorax sp. dw_308 TaxID=2721546 RepID=UPI001C465130|nr:hypothetical protein [Variovorax sp. dw_308]